MCLDPREGALFNVCEFCAGGNLHDLIQWPLLPEEQPKADAAAAEKAAAAAAAAGVGLDGGCRSAGAGSSSGGGGGGGSKDRLPPYTPATLMAVASQLTAAVAYMHG